MPARSNDPSRPTAAISPLLWIPHDDYRSHDRTAARLRVELVPRWAWPRQCGAEVSIENIIGTNGGSIQLGNARGHCPDHIQITTFNSAYQLFPHNLSTCILVELARHSIPIAQRRCSGLAQSIFSPPPRRRAPRPDSASCRRAAGLKMLCIVPRRRNPRLLADMPNANTRNFLLRRARQ